MKQSFGDLALDILEDIKEEGVPHVNGAPITVAPIVENTGNIAGYVPDITTIDLDKVGFPLLNEGERRKNRIANAAEKATRAVEKTKYGTHDRAEASIKAHKYDNLYWKTSDNLKAKRRFKRNQVKESELLKEFQEVVLRGKQIIEEMTSCGMLGVNMAGPQRVGGYTKKKKKKNALLAHLSRK